MEINENINQILFIIGDLKISIHQTIIIWICLLFVVAIILAKVGNIFKNADPKQPPSKTIVVFELLFDTCKGVIGENLNNTVWRYLPFMGTMLIVMVISNLLGLVGLQPPTSNFSVNLTLALMVFFLIHGTNIKEVGIKGKLKAWAEPMAFLFPLNVIGDLALPVSLSFRLFGNILGGSIISALLYSLIKTFMPFTGLMYIATPFLHMYFDIFAGVMQSYIFFTLASFFLGDAIDTSKETNI